MRPLTTRSWTAAATRSGLRGDELTLTARILAVADVYEAMTATRPYRGPLPATTALAELEAAAA